MLRDELLNSKQAEVILAGSLGMQEAGQNTTCGLDIGKANLLLDGIHPHPILGQLSIMDYPLVYTFEVDLDPTTESFLMDHALNRIPLLPGVMGIEGFLEAARSIACLLGLDEKFLSAGILEDIQFQVPVKFYRDQVRHLFWKSSLMPGVNGVSAYGSLESELERPHHPRERLQHFSGKITLGALTPIPMAQLPAWDETRVLKSEDIYRLYFHGPAFQVLEEVCRSGDSLIGKLRMDRPPLSTSLPLKINLPILVELCLQTASIWEIGKTGFLGLPASIDSLTLYPQLERASQATPEKSSKKLKSHSSIKAAIYAVVTPAVSSDGQLIFNGQVFDARNKLLLELTGYRTAHLPYSVENDLLLPFQALVR